MTTRILHPLKHPRSHAPTIKPLHNQIRRARTPKVLNCGCTISPGTLYHSCALLLNGSFVYSKQHLSGCVEKLH